MALTSREEIVASFQQHFVSGAAVACYRAPGRVNLMGEHTDYNEGLVLPMALDMACYVGVASNCRGTLRVYSANLNETREWLVGNIATAQPAHDWGDYVLGVAVELARNGFRISPCDMYLKSEVPVGAGLSSSASLEVGTAVALLAAQPIEKLELAKLCQRVESQFVGMPCGIMDQYASVFGEPGSAIKIDCRTLESETVQLPGGIRVMVVNSLVKHELGTSAYRQRVAECQEAVAAIRQVIKGITSLRDVSLVQLDEIQGSIPLTPRKRARHVVTDNARVLDFAAAARRSDLSEMGRLFIASHRSAQYDYEISCEEIDFLVDTAIKLDGVYGARMTGGGFGGCTVNLVAPHAIASFDNLLSEAYRSRYDKTPLFYECVPAAGAGPLR